MSICQMLCTNNTKAQFCSTGHNLCSEAEVFIKCKGYVVGCFASIHNGQRQSEKRICVTQDWIKIRKKTWWPSSHNWKGCRSFAHQVLSLTCISPLFLGQNPIVQSLVLLQRARLRECSLGRRRAASCTVRPVRTVTRKSGNSLCITQKITQNAKKSPTLFSLWGSSILEEVIQRSCEASVFGDTQNPAWHGSEQWSWTRWSAEVSPQWHCESVQPLGKASDCWK